VSVPLWRDLSALRESHEFFAASGAAAAAWLLARPAGFEPATFRSGGERSIP
jgi:hypothetical protein